MKLSRAAKIMGGELTESMPEPQITGLSYDSRRVTRGDLFFSIPGSNSDGHDFAVKAFEAGAVALVCERAIDVRSPQVLVGDCLVAMNRLAAPFFGSPSDHLEIAGVTGTNGKTTTAYLLESIFEAAGRKTGLIGTVETRFAGGVSVPGDRTTPESIDLQRLLAQMVEAGADTCAMEVTSIGIQRRRIEGTRFAAVAFTNLTQDHLDYHPSMAEYYLAKRRLFSPEFSGYAAINLDDEYGARLVGETELQVLTYGVDSRAELLALNIELGPRSSDFRAASSELDLAITVPAPGRFNVYNALAAIAVSHLMGVDPTAIARGIAGVRPIPGRLERVDRGQNFSVLVDFAHTPAGIRGVLAAAREVARGRVILVFGCGGDRDREKRSQMGEAAGDSDIAIATSDNPRNEDPGAILRSIEQGLKTSPPPGGYRIVEDRHEAIRQALVMAEKDDVVVIAGKGHEACQIVSGVRIPFDDRDVAAEILEEIKSK
ncbi:MAG: UDP-N-acetylmuramoyl-L-alanyl-D-glutamate--2,6-diaminopimelate ligase [Actinomycetota bacterium]